MKAFNRVKEEEEEFSGQSLILLFLIKVLFFLSVMPFIKLVFYLPKAVEKALMWKSENLEPIQASSFTYKSSDFSPENS